MIDDEQHVSDARSEASAPARIHPALAIEALLSASISTLLCWNAWPWLAVHSGTPGSDTPNDPVAATMAAILLYGLAWPAIAAAMMGLQQFAFARLPGRTRLLVSAALLSMVVVALCVRLAAAAAQP